MPKIDQEKVVTVLQDHYFDHHTAMHLSRERVDVYDPIEQAIVSVQPLLDPAHKCEDCKDMVRAGDPGSGTELVVMHHDMINVFRYLLREKGIHLGVKWERHHEHGKPSHSRWVRAHDCIAPDCYAPEALWDLDDPRKLPTEIRALFSNKDQNFLRDAFAGVKKRVEIDARRETGKDPHRDNGPVDELGKFVERGVTSGEPDGRGFHDTIHEYLGSRERLSVPGAEMNKLRNSLYNDYFWSLHLWIDGQYGRLLENVGVNFDTSPQPPDDPMDAMAKMHNPTHARMHAAMPA